MLPAALAVAELQAAAADGNLASVRSLLRQHPSVLNAATRDTGTTALMEAARYGHTACLTALLEAGAEPNAATDGGMTACMLAVSSGHLRCLEALLEAGADASAVSICNQQTAVHIAARYGDFRSLRALLAAGAAPSDPDRDGDSPLHCCGLSKMKDEALCVQMLLAAGGDPNACNLEGRTPLHSTMALHGNLETLELLLKAGADPNAQGARCTPTHSILVLSTLHGYVENIARPVPAFADHLFPPSALPYRLSR